MDVDELVERARGRARASRYVAHRSAVERLRTELVDTSVAAERLGLAATNAVDGYLAATDLEAVVSRHGVIRDDTGSVTLRTTSVDLDVVRDLVSAGDVPVRLTWPSPSTSANAEPEPMLSPERWRGCVADRSTIDVPTPAGGWGAPWPNVAEIEAVLPHEKWTLVGGLMAQLHGIHAGIDAVRPTNDVESSSTSRPPAASRPRPHGRSSRSAASWRRRSTSETTPRYRFK
jgi:hypothetical protein